MKHLSIAFLFMALAASAAEPKPDAAAKRPSAKRGADVAGAPFDAAKVAPEFVPPGQLKVPDGLEVTLWARTPLLFNPTDMDMDAAGRIWVCEGVNYRRALNRKEGDRIVVLEDTDGDGVADSSHTFVQDPELVSPMGISVFGNKVVVSQPPHILVYTDVNGDAKFDPAVDKREVFLSGFNGRNHDHSLHTVVGGPDGMWYFTHGNCGARVADKDGRVFQSGGPYYQKGAGRPEWFNDPTEYAGKPSADGRVYAGGFAARVRPDGRGLQIIGDGFRNSYELCINSLGDVYQSDNDDPPACRNTWLMEGGFLGYFSKDGQRQWQVDRRPGQTVPVAQWRQEDPGSLPAGDVYGTGSPTGVLFYENGALPAEYEGSFLACEARARVLQRYRPQLSKTGAAVELGPRSNFLTCDNTMFRPSDAMVGADGALYVADWYDSGVGGHNTRDTGFCGAIYRIAPKGFKRTLPKLTGDEIQDGITLLKNPAPSVRFTGFEKLRRAGASALPAVRKLLAGDNRWFSARAVWLLPHLGPDGLAEGRALLTHHDAERRLLAFRALRAAGQDVMALAKQLAADSSAAVRREVAVSLRVLDTKDKLPLAVGLFSTASGADRHYLDACGMAAAGLEDDVWRVLDKAQGKAPVEWSDAHAWRTWRLLPKSAVAALATRANTASLPLAARRQAMETLAFIGSKEAVETIASLAAGKDELANAARWWMLNRGVSQWAEFGTRELLKQRGIYDPDTVEITPVSVPQGEPTKLPPTAELMKLTGNAAAGKALTSRCVTCHQFGGVGADYGPDLLNWVANQGREAFFEAVRTPSASIALGYSGTTITLKDGDVVEGIVFSQQDPVVIMSTGALLQYIPAARIKKTVKMGNKSLMLPPEVLGLTAQDLADLAAYLETYTGEPGR